MILIFTLAKSKSSYNKLILNKNNLNQNDFKSKNYNFDFENQDLIFKIMPISVYN